MGSLTLDTSPGNRENESGRKESVSKAMKFGVRVEDKMPEGTRHPSVIATCAYKVQTAGVGYRKIVRGLPDRFLATTCLRLRSLSTCGPAGQTAHTHALGRLDIGHHFRQS